MTHGHHTNHRSPNATLSRRLIKTVETHHAMLTTAGRGLCTLQTVLAAGGPGRAPSFLYSNASLFFRSEGSVIIALLLKSIKVWPVSPQKWVHSVLICDSSVNTHASACLKRVECQSTKSRSIQSNYPLTGNLKSSALLSLYAPLMCPLDRRLGLLSFI